MTASSRIVLLLLAANFLLALWHFLIRPDQDRHREDYPVVTLVHKREVGALSIKSEHAVLLQKPEAADILVDSSSDDVPIESILCLELGQFDGLTQFSASLDGLALEYSVEEIQVLDMDNPFFRVQTPAFESREVAIVALEGIRESIERSSVPIDSYIVPTGPLENAISLGLFSDRANALNVQRLLADQDIDVIVEQEGRSTSRYLVALKREYYDDFKEEIDTIVDALQLGFSVAENVCETIAHAE
jgi:hypothetical protein